MSEYGRSKLAGELAAFEEAVRSIPEVMECFLMTGEFDYLLRVVVSDMADFERMHKQSLTRLPGVARVNSSVAIRTVQKKTERVYLSSFHTFVASRLPCRFTQARTTWDHMLTFFTAFKLGN